jgi:hypothetical protein
MLSAEEAIDALYQQAAQIVGSGAGASSAEHVSSAHKALTSFAQVGDQVSLGLFPLALALLIFHENFQSAAGDGRFRVAYVLGRAAAIAVLIHPWAYGRLCGLITYAAGGHGGWLSTDALLGSVTTSVDGLKGAWYDYVGDDPGISDSLSAMLQILPLIGIWMVLVCSLLFAYVAGALLSISQAVLLSVLLAVGKTCLVATLVPGVSLGGSWARSLAKVAAWSTIAALITGLMLHAMPDVKEMVRNMSYTRMLRTAGQFIVLAICTFSIPAITEKIFSGAAPAGNAALEAVSKGWQGARSMGRSFTSGGAHGVASARMDGRPGFGGDGGGGGHGGATGGRPHKVSPSRLREGLAALGTLAAAPLAAATALIAGREPQPDLSPTPSSGNPARSRQALAAEEARPRSAPSAEAEREACIVQTQLALVREKGARPENLDRAALGHKRTARLDAGERGALRAAYPDLGFDPQGMKPVEQRILAVLDHYQGHYAGWRDGGQGRQAFAEARELAQVQVQAKSAQTRAGDAESGGRARSAPAGSAAPERQAGAARPSSSSAPSSPPPSFAGGSGANVAKRAAAPPVRPRPPADEPPRAVRSEVDS